MQEALGPFRNRRRRSGRALSRLRAMRAELPELAVPAGAVCNPALADWFDLRASLAAAEAVAAAALARTESRGAHQRDDHPDTDPAWVRNQRVTMTGDGAVAVT